MAFDAGSITSKMGLDISPFAQGMMQATSMSRLFPQVVNDFIASPLLGVVGIARQVGSTLGELFSTGFKLAMDFETAEVAFGVLLGGADKAKATLKDLSDFAASTPFEFPELQGAARSLLAFGTAQNELIPAMRKVGDIASAINQPIGQIAEIYGKARVQGRLFMEDINQLTGRGIPVIQELAKQFGVAESEVRQLVSSGQVGFANLDQAFTSLTSTGGKFAGMMERQSHTIAGLWSSVKDNFNTLLRDMAQPVVLAIQPKLEEVLKWMSANGPKVQDVLKDLTQSVMVLAEAALKAAAAIKPALDMAAALTDEMGLTDPNKRFGNPYQRPATAPRVVEGLSSDMLATPTGREFLSGVADQYMGAARALALGAETRSNPRVHTPRTDAWDALAKSVRSNASAFAEADLAMEQLVERAARGGSVSQAEFAAAADKALDFARSVDRARDAVQRLQQEEMRAANRPTALSDEMGRALAQFQRILDQAAGERQPLNQPSNPAAGRPTINIERVVVQPLDVHSSAAELADKLFPILQKAVQQQIADQGMLGDLARGYLDGLNL